MLKSELMRTAAQPNSLTLFSVLYLSGHTDYSLTFNESAGMCGDFGGRLATYDELKAVWLLGYHKCR